MRASSVSILIRLSALVGLMASGLGWLAPLVADEGSYRERPFGLADVRSILVAELGGGEGAAATRNAVIEALRAVGFRCVERAAEADAVLSGSIVTKLVNGEPLVVFRTAVLHAPSGETLWHLRLRSARSPHKQAGRMARALRSSVEQAVWKAAREVP
jgi:hypothetical protein